MENQIEQLLPLYIPEVLDMIITKLQATTAIRLVCKTWNKSWIRIASNKPQKVVNQIEPVAIVQLHSILKNSSCPSVFFQTFNCFLTDDFQVTQDILTEFGWSLKTLNIIHFLPDGSNILSILSDWCPNLENLDIFLFNLIDDLDFGRADLKSVKLSNLKCFSYRDSFCIRTSYADIDLLKWIVKASVNLKTLNITSSYTPTLPIDTIQGFEKDQEIKIRLDKFTIDCECTPDFHPLTQFLNMRLIQNLKTLTLKCNKQFPKKEISNMLKKLSHSLETLTFTTKVLQFKQNSIDTVHLDDYVNYIEFPYMSKLKVFNHFAFDNAQLDFNDFLSKVPNLENLTVGVNCWGYSFRVDSVLAKISELAPHLALKELILLGGIDELEFPSIYPNELFPNISKLFIGLDFCSKKYDGIICSQKWYEIVFEKFSEMKNLRDLTIDFIHFDWTDNMDLTTIFDKLTACKNLTYLTIANSAGIEGLPTEGIEGLSLMTAFSHCLSHIPELYRLRLYNLEIKGQFLEAMQSTTRVEFLKKDPKKESLLCE